MVQVLDIPHELSRKKSRKIHFSVKHSKFHEEKSHERLIVSISNYLLLHLCGTCLTLYQDTINLTNVKYRIREGPWCVRSVKYAIRTKICSTPNMVMPLLLSKQDMDDTVDKLENLFLKFVVFTRVEPNLT